MFCSYLFGLTGFAVIQLVAEYLGRHAFEIAPFSWSAIHKLGHEAEHMLQRHSAGTRAKKRMLKCPCPGVYTPQAVDSITVEEPTNASASKHCVSMLQSAVVQPAFRHEQVNMTSLAEPLTPRLVFAVISPPCFSNPSTAFRG
jgi:hypothetical protein